jgi:hypothetical protein
MIAKSALLRRRAVLQFAVGAAGTATVLYASSNAAIAAPKISKAAVAYQDSPNGDKRCDKCAQFQPPDACKMVEGSISPQGSCRIFIPLHPA